ncbi:MAG: DJ-1/PfpI family protein [Eubacterium sp.]|nr:DJ-1/PfpI family protein [Eubacterium sp.]
MLFADGFETVEALMTVDILRRGGVEVTMASIYDSLEVTSAQEITIKTDSMLKHVNIMEYDIIILPGGQPGTTNLGQSADVKLAVMAMNGVRKWVAAICAAPTVFGQYGILNGKKACCYPGLEESLTGAEVTYDNVTIDGNIITSRGLGTALDFALAILEQLTSTAKSAMIRKSVVA